MNTKAQLPEPSGHRKSRSNMGAIVMTFFKIIEDTNKYHNDTLQGLRKSKLVYKKKFQNKDRNELNGDQANAKYQLNSSLN